MPLVVSVATRYARSMSQMKRILIVEDEPLISMMLENFLECLDKDIAGTAESVSEAMIIIESAVIDAVILDLNLRGGEKSTPVARELVDRGIPFILASGGGDHLDPIFDGVPMLMKPFTIQSMENALEDLSNGIPMVRAA